jgi:hypothetical protein
MLAQRDNIIDWGEVDYLSEKDENPDKSAAISYIFIGIS